MTDIILNAEIPVLREMTAAIASLVEITVSLERRVEALEGIVEPAALIARIEALESDVAALQSTRIMLEEETVDA